MAIITNNTNINYWYKTFINERVLKLKKTKSNGDYTIALLVIYVVDDVRSGEIFYTNYNKDDEWLSYTRRDINMDNIARLLFKLMDNDYLLMHW